MVSRKRILLSGWLLVLTLYGTLGSSRDAEANTNYVPCNAADYCTGNTWWGYYQSDTYYGQASSAAPPYASWVWYSAHIRGTNWYHPDVAIEEEICDYWQQPYTACTTGLQFLCDVAYPPAGCGPNNTSHWYAATKHYFDGGTGGNIVFTATSTAYNRGTQNCWLSMDCGF